MKVKRLVGFGLLMGALIIMAKLSGFGEPRREAPPIKIGVVNMVEVFNKSKKLQQYQVELNTEEKVHLARQKQLSDDIEALRKEMQALDTQSETWEAYNERITVMSIQKENQSKVFARQGNRKVNTRMAEVYHEVRAAIDKYAAEKGFTLILRTDPPKIFTEGNKIEDAQSSIAIRSVLYYDTAMDITQDIINIHNGEK